MAFTTPREPSATQRVLRNITVVLIIPAIPFIIVSCLIHYPVIAIGAMDLFSSFFFWALHRSRNARKKPLPLLVAALSDFLIGLGYLFVMFPVWMGRSRVTLKFYHRLDLFMFVVYASCFYMINMVIHFYLALANLIARCPEVFFWDDLILGERSRCRECPHCRERNGESGPLMGARQIRVDSGAQYSLLGDAAEDSPRPSGEVV